MNFFRRRKVQMLLSQYLDNELNDERRQKFEEYLNDHPDVQNELKKMRMVKKYVSEKSGIPENPNFWSDFSNVFNYQRHRVSEYVLFPQRLAPAFIAIGAIVFIAFGVILYTKHGEIAEYFSRRSEEIQQTYEDNIMKDWIMPLFAKTDKDKALEFAMFGTLPLGDTANTMLRVDNTAEHGYRIQIGIPEDRSSSAVKVDEFYEDIQATPAQKRTIDSLLFFAQKQIESSVLISNDQSIAINQDLAKLNTRLLSGIAANLAPMQQVRFERFLDAKNTPYTFVPAKSYSPSAQAFASTTIHEIPQSRNFVILQRDSVAIRKVEVNLDSLRQKMERIIQTNQHIPAQYETITRQLAKKSRELAQKALKNAQDIYMISDTDIISIQFRKGDVDEKNIILRVKPRPLQSPVFRREKTLPEIHLKIFRDDVENYITDTLTLNIMKKIPDINFYLEGLSLDIPALNPTDRRIFPDTLKEFLDRMENLRDSYLSVLHDFQNRYRDLREIERLYSFGSKQYNEALRQYQRSHDEMKTALDQYQKHMKIYKDAMKRYLKKSIEMHE